jgi:hypothetical protein
MNTGLFFFPILYDKKLANFPLVLVKNPPLPQKKPIKEKDKTFGNGYFLFQNNNNNYYYYYYYYY